MLPNIKSNKNSDEPQLWFTTDLIGPTKDVVLRCNWRDQGTQMMNYTMHTNGFAFPTCSSRDVVCGTPTRPHLVRNVNDVRDEIIIMLYEIDVSV